VSFGAALIEEAAYWEWMDEMLESLRDFVSESQLKALEAGLRGEEAAAFKEIVERLTNTIATMPEVYGQDGKGDGAIAYLHYFSPSWDWWITEKDSVEDEPQHQAFGLVRGFTIELGYVPISELIKFPYVELDFYWTPKTLGEIKKGLKR